MEQKVHFIIPVCILFSVLYIIFAIRPLGTEYQFVPAWTKAATPRATQESTDENAPDAPEIPGQKVGTIPGFNEAIPFRIGQTLGYFTADGTILRVVTFPYKATISGSCYALFSTGDDRIPFYDAAGTEAGAISKNGFPYFEDNRMYLFLPGGASFSQLDDAGNALWTYEGYAPITSFDSSKAGCVAGLADGTLISFTPDGKTDQNFNPGGSDYPVILGAAISETGSYIAAISGQDKQRFILAKKDGGHSTIVYHEYLEKSLNRQVLVQFSRNEKTVYYDFEGGLGIVNVKSGKHAHIPLQGRVLSIKESEKSGLIFVLSKSNAQFTVSVLEPFDSIVGSFSFKSPSAFIETKDGALFVGRDGEISRIDVVRK